MLPVARFGNISRMPREPITVERRDGTRESLLVYLAECRSWGGHSGSPAFWVFPAVRVVMANVQGAPTPVPISDRMEVVGLLGLVSGHFDIEESAETTGDILLGKITTPINAGMAFITPAEEIRALIMRDDVVDERQERAAAIAASGTGSTGARFDSVPPPGASK